MESLYEVRCDVTRNACRNHPFLTTQYGSRSGVWRILRLFEKHRIPCTAYAVGQALEMNPEVGEALKEGGHEFASHGWRWIDRSAWTVEEEEENVRKTIRGAQRYHRCVRVCDCEADPYG
jgi:peptidoglycan/xylan/chitin deacetylase (PgdA/CDA1 family)